MVDTTWQQRLKSGIGAFLLSENEVNSASNRKFIFELIIGKSNEGDPRLNTLAGGYEAVQDNECDTPNFRQHGTESPLTKYVLDVRTIYRLFALRGSECSLLSGMNDTI